MKKIFAIQAAKQLINTHNVNFVSKQEKTNHLRLAEKVVCCEWLPMNGFSAINTELTNSLLIG